MFGYIWPCTHPKGNVYCGTKQVSILQLKAPENSAEKKLFLSKQNNNSADSDAGAGENTSVEAAGATAEENANSSWDGKSNIVDIVDSDLPVKDHINHLTGDMGSNAMYSDSIEGYGAPGETSASLYYLPIGHTAQPPKHKIQNTNTSDENSLTSLAAVQKLWDAEKMVGNIFDLSRNNPHIYQPDKYISLGRRFVLQYPYTYVDQYTSAAPKGQEIIPIEAPPEIVELVAKKSALIEASKVNPIDESVTKKILRSGDYWNGVWKEDVYSKTALRDREHKKLDSIKARINPGSDFYKLVAKMKKISPRLLYIINVDD